MSESTRGASRKFRPLLFFAPFFIGGLALIWSGYASDQPDSQMEKVHDTEFVAIEPGIGSGLIILDSDYSNTKIDVTPYAVIEGSWLRNIHMVITTKYKSAIVNNRFEDGCWFTIDGVDYKSPTEIKRAIAILEKSPEINFSGNQIDAYRQPIQTLGGKR